LSTQVYTLHVVLDAREENRSVTIYVAPDLGPSDTSGASAQLTPEAIARARELFTPENYDKLMQLIQLAMDGGLCFSDAVKTAAEFRAYGWINPPLDMAEHCASAFTDIQDLIRKNASDKKSVVPTNQQDATLPKGPYLVKSCKANPWVYHFYSDPSNQLKLLVPHGSGLIKAIYDMYQLVGTPLDVAKEILDPVPDEVSMELWDDGQGAFFVRVIIRTEEKWYEFDTPISRDDAAEFDYYSCVSPA